MGCYSTKVTQGKDPHGQINWLTGERSVTYIVVVVVFSKCISIKTKPMKAKGGNFTPNLERPVWVGAII